MRRMYVALLVPALVWVPSAAAQSHPSEIAPEARPRAIAEAQTRAHRIIDGASEGQQAFESSRQVAGFVFALSQVWLDAEAEADMAALLATADSVIVRSNRDPAVRTRVQRSTADLSAEVARSADRRGRVERRGIRAVLARICPLYPFC